VKLLTCVLDYRHDQRVEVFVPNNAFDHLFVRHSEFGAVFSEQLRQEGSVHAVCVNRGPGTTDVETLEKERRALTQLQVWPMWMLARSRQDFPCVIDYEHILQHK